MLKIIQRISLTHIILLGFVLRILMYCAIGSWNPDVEKNRILIRDAKGYETLAENLLHYHTYRGVYDTAKISSDSNIIKAAFLPVNYDTFRVPGYPAFLACVYYISGIKPYIAIFIQLLLNIFSLVLIYRITLLLFNIKEVAIIAGLLFAIDIHSIFVSNLLVSETFFIFLFLISLLYFIS
ncbi:MAG: hypothetical protein ACLQQ4_14250, partial [Bacteroidia bacterium]